MYGDEDLEGRAFFTVGLQFSFMPDPAPGISGFPDREDLYNFVLGSAVLAAAFAAFYGEFELNTAFFYISASAVVLATREFGVRAAANVLDGYVSLELSGEGSTTTLFGAIISVITGLPIILLFPVYSDVSRKKYEQWGRSIDVVWAAYKFKIARWGVVALLAGFMIAGSFGFDRVAQMFALFAFFQMMPFDYSGIPTGPLDGAEILRWSGFWWLFLTGLSLLMIALTVI